MNEAVAVDVDEDGWMDGDTARDDDAVKEKGTSPSLPPMPLATVIQNNLHLHRSSPPTKRVDFFQCLAQGTAWPLL